MNIWQKPISPEILAASHADSATSHLGIEFIEVGDDFIRARAPVDSRTTWQGALHNGVNVVLAETLGSCGAQYATASRFRAVGLSITAQHLKAATSGWVTGTTRALKNDSSGQVWRIDIRDDAGDLVCASEITVSLLNAR